jgi:hypothetical protein
MNKKIWDIIVIVICLILLFFPILAFQIPFSGRGGVTNLGEYLLGGGFGGGVGMVIVVLSGSLLFSVVSNRIYGINKKNKWIIPLVMCLLLVFFPFLGGAEFVSVQMISYLFVVLLFLIMFINIAIFGKTKVSED